jgi:hypothetical protein
MRFWVYGRDAVSNAPRDPLFVEAADEAAARAEASGAGMRVEDVEPVQPRPVPPPAAQPPASGTPAAESGYTFAGALVVGLRVLAGVAAVWWLGNTAVLIEQAQDVAARARELDRVVAGAGRSAVLAANRAVFEGLVTGLGWVGVLLGVGEVLRLAVAAERQARASAGSRGRR